MRTDVVLSLNGDIFTLAAAKGDKSGFEAVLQENSRVTARLIVDEDLTDIEKAEIIESFEAEISLPKGQLILSTRYSQDEDDDMDSVSIALPKGNYRMGFHTTLAGPFAPARIEKETIEKYFTRTRPDEVRMSWIDQELTSEDFWVGLIIHLTPFEGEVIAPKKPVKPGKGAIKPAICPPGIWVNKPLGWENFVQTGLIYTHKIPHLVEKLELVPVEGGPITIPIPEAILAYWIAWVCGETHPRLELRCDPSFDPDWPNFREGIQATQTPDGWTVDIEGNNARWSQFAHLRQVLAIAEGLPDGSYFRLDCASDDGEGMKGRLRFAGAVHGGNWAIDQTYPALNAAELTDMLALVRQAETGLKVTARDEREATFIQDAIGKRDFMLRQNPPKRDGRTFTLSEYMPELMPFLVAWAFAARYAKRLPMIARGEDLAEWDGLMDSIAELGASFATGEVVLEGRFATYTLGDLASLGIADAPAINEFHDWLLGNGFVHLADLNSTETFTAVFRGYEMPGSPVYAGVIASGLTPPSFDFFTPFPDGFTLTTTASDRPKPKISTIKKSKMHRHELPGTVAERYGSHLAALKELSATHGEPEAAKGLAGFAKQLDDVFCRLHDLD